MGDGLDLALLPGAVSPLVAAEVAGERRACRVLAAFPTCVYLDLGTHERVLAVLAADAVALPIGIRLGVPSHAVRWGVEPGERVVVGHGRVRLPRHEVVAARAQRPSRVRPAPRRPGLLSLPEPGVLGDLAHDLTASALSGWSVEAGVRGLVGVGRGLTPSGDDALCGVLLVLGAVDAEPARTALATLRTTVQRALPATTSLSAALLVAAGAGYAVPAVARLVMRAVSGGSTVREPAGPTDGALVGPTDGALVGPTDGLLAGPTDGALVDRVLAIGHSSGRDLLSGVSGALRAVDASLSTTFPPTASLSTAPQEGAHRG